MDKREILKSMLRNLIDDKPEQASMDFHNFITPKAREVFGLTSAAPEVTDTETNPDSAPNE